MNNPDHISESLETIFGFKYLNSLMRIRDLGWKKFGSEIRDKHPGSATLYLNKSAYCFSAFFVPPERVSTFYDLVWIVGVNDFVLKFISGNTLNKLHGTQAETLSFSFNFSFGFV
jgi:hypothetical protein